MRAVYRITYYDRDYQHRTGTVEVIRQSYTDTRERFEQDNPTCGITLVELVWGLYNE